MKVVHLSSECYPAAKVGGLADVVGSLPKYLAEEGVDASVVMPKYATKWFKEHLFDTIFEGSATLGDGSFAFSIQRESGEDFDFPLFAVDIPQFFNRTNIYSEDDFDAFACFQIAVLEWMNSSTEKPNVIHCHDHHTGLVPFMLTQSARFDAIKHIPTVFTVHNAEYQGIYDLAKSNLLPDFEEQNIGLLDWDGNLNCLAAGLKCCWRITTVSPSYMKELRYQSSGLEWLLQNEQQKSQGILNGIDETIWNPATDDLIAYNFSRNNIKKGKQKNKRKLCEEFNLNPDYPTVSYIGRLAREKGADLLPDTFRKVLESPEKVNFIVLGSGDPELHRRFEEMDQRYTGYFDATLDYNEPLAHQIYAGSDFIIMPSRVEPCGLNQMYSMRYGTIPIVRNTGGLKDTVQDISENRGSGILFNEFTLGNAVHATYRAVELFQSNERMAEIRKRIMSLNFSWNTSAKAYIKLYDELVA